MMDEYHKSRFFCVCQTRSHLFLQNTSFFNSMDLTRSRGLDLECWLSFFFPFFSSVFFSFLFLALSSSFSFFSLFLLIFSFSCSFFSFSFFSVTTQTFFFRKKECFGIYIIFAVRSPNQSIDRPFVILLTWRRSLQISEWVPSGARFWCHIFRRFFDHLRVSFRSQLWLKIEFPRMTRQILREEKWAWTQNFREDDDQKMLAVTFLTYRVTNNMSRDFYFLLNFLCVWDWNLPPSSLMLIPS